MRRTAATVLTAAAVVPLLAAPALAGTAATCRPRFAPEYTAQAVLTGGELVVTAGRAGVLGARPAVTVTARGVTTRTPGGHGSSAVVTTTRHTTARTATAVVTWRLIGPDVSCTLRVRA